MSFYRKCITIIGILSVTTSVFANSGNQATPMLTPQPVVTATQSASTKININTSTLKDFVKVKGLSKSKAKNIMTYHKKHGEFKSLDDLKLVKGFKKMKANLLKSIQDQLTV